MLYGNYHGTPYRSNADAVVYKLRCSAARDRVVDPVIRGVAAIDAVPLIKKALNSRFFPEEEGVREDSDRARR